MNEKMRMTAEDWERLMEFLQRARETDTLDLEDQGKIINVIRGALEKRMAESKKKLPWNVEMDDSGTVH